MSYLRYLCLIVYSGVYHLLCCVFVLFVFVMCIVRDTGLSFNKFYYSGPEKIIFWGGGCLFNFYVAQIYRKITDLTFVKDKRNHLTLQFPTRILCEI